MCYDQAVYLEGDLSSPHVTYLSTEDKKKNLGDNAPVLLQQVSKLTGAALKLHFTNIPNLTTIPGSRDLDVGPGVQRVVISQMPHLKDFGDMIATKLEMKLDAAGAVGDLDNRRLTLMGG